MKRFVTCFLALVAITLGCSPECGSLHDERGDVLVVVNCDEGVWDGRSRWEVVEDLRIGSESGDGTDGFTRVQAVAADSRGRMFVSDQSPDRIEVFSRNGEPTGTLGGSGDGPGEFRWVVGLAADNFDRLWVIDYGNQRYTVFGPDGDLAFSAPREVGSWWMPWPGRLEGDRIFELEDRAESSQSRIRILDLDLNAVESIPFPIREWSTIPFGPDPLVAIGPGGVSWSGGTDPYVLIRRDAAGDTVLATARTVRGEPLTRRDRREALDLSMARRQQVAVLAEETGSLASTDLSQVPRTEPVLRVIWIDDVGFLWVGLHGEKAGDGRRYDIFAGDGVYQGELVLPFSIRAGTVPHFRDGHVYAVTTDEMDREFVVRARIERP